MRYTNVAPAHYIQTFTGTTSGAASTKPGQQLAMNGSTVNTIQNSRGRVAAFQVSSDTTTASNLTGALVTVKLPFKVSAVERPEVHAVLFT